MLVRANKKLEDSGLYTEACHYSTTSFFYRQHV